MTLTWTDQPPSVPTKPGEYWANLDRPGAVPAMGSLIRRPGMMGHASDDLWFKGEFIKCVAEMADYQWAGPIVIAEPEQKSYFAQRLENDPKLAKRCEEVAETVRKAAAEPEAATYSPNHPLVDDIWKLLTKYELGAEYSVDDLVEEAVELVKSFIAEPEKETEAAVSQSPLPDGLELWGIWSDPMNRWHCTYIESPTLLLSKTKAEAVLKDKCRDEHPWKVRRYFPPEPHEEPQHPLLAAMQRLSDYVTNAVPEWMRTEAADTIARIRTSHVEPLIAALKAREPWYAELREALDAEARHHERAAEGYGPGSWPDNQARMIRELLARVPGGGE